MATFDGNDVTGNTTAALAGSSASHTGVQTGDYTIALGQVPRDDDPPDVTFDPVSSSTLAPADVVTVEILDNDPGVTLASVSITVKFANIDATFVVYDGTDFVYPFNSGSSVSGTSNNRSFEIAHNFGWPAEIEALRVTAVDGDANATDVSAAYDVPAANPGPTIIDIAPVTNTDISPSELIEFEVTDNTGDLQTVVVFIRFADRDEVFTLYGGFGSDVEYPFVGSVNAIGNGLRFSFTHVEAWPADIEITVLARDASGNTGGGTWAYYVPTATPGAPTITIVSPTPGVAAGQPGGFPADPTAAATTPIVLDVVDANPGNRLVVVVARYLGTDAEEVVYRRGQFRGNYITGSSQLSITNGVRLTCRRDGGWPGSPTFEIDAVDSDGNLAS